MLFTVAKKDAKYLGEFAGNFVTKNFPKLPNLVTLDWR